MTRHLRNSHRNHRKATWGLVAVLVVAIAAVVIPIASGTGDKTYTISLSPTSVCSSATDGGASTVLTLKNTSSPQSFASAEVYFPPNTVFQVTAPATLVSNTSNANSGGTKDIVTFRNLNVTPGSSVQVTVKFKANVAAERPGESGREAVEQLQRRATGQPVQARSCPGHIPDDAGASVPDRVRQGVPRPEPRLRVHDGGRRVRRQRPSQGVDGEALRQDRGCAVVPGSGARGPSTSSSSDGTYTFTDVPTGNDYKVCVAAAGLRTPRRCGACRARSGTPSADRSRRRVMLRPRRPGTCFRT